MRWNTVLVRNVSIPVSIVHWRKWTNSRLICFGMKIWSRKTISHRSFITSEVLLQTWTDWNVSQTAPKRNVSKNSFKWANLMIMEQGTPGNTSWWSTHPFPMNCKSHTALGWGWKSIWYLSGAPWISGLVSPCWIYSTSLSSCLNIVSGSKPDEQWKWEEEQWGIWAKHRISWKTSRFKSHTSFERLSNYSNRSCLFWTWWPLLLFGFIHEKEWIAIDVGEEEFDYKSVRLHMFPWEEV